jgi:hypothetical protein
MEATGLIKQKQLISPSHTCELARKERQTNEASGITASPASPPSSSGAVATRGRCKAPPSGDSTARSGNSTASTSGMMVLLAVAI